MVLQVPELCMVIWNCIPAGSLYADLNWYSLELYWNLSFCRFTAPGMPLHYHPSVLGIISASQEFGARLHNHSSPCKPFQCPPHPVPFRDLQYHSSTCSIIPAPGVSFRALPDTIFSLFFWSVASWTSFFGSWCFLMGAWVH